MISPSDAAAKRHIKELDVFDRQVDELNRNLDAMNKRLKRLHDDLVGSKLPLQSRSMPPPR